MGVSLRLMAPTVITDNWGIYWLSADELVSFNVTNVTD